MKNAAKTNVEGQRVRLQNWRQFTGATLFSCLIDMHTNYQHGQSFNQQCAENELRSLVTNPPPASKAEKATSKAISKARATLLTEDQIRSLLAGQGPASHSSGTKKFSNFASTVNISVSEFMGKKVMESSDEFNKFKATHLGLDLLDSFWEMVSQKYSNDALLLERVKHAVHKLGVGYQLELMSFNKMAFDSENYDVLVYKKKPTSNTAVLLNHLGQGNARTAHFHIAHLETEQNPPAPPFLHGSYIAEEQDYPRICEELIRWFKIFKFLKTFFTDQPKEGTGPSKEQTTKIRDIYASDVKFVGLKGVKQSIRGKRVIAPFSVATTLACSETYNTNKGIAYIMSQLRPTDSVDYIKVDSAHLWTEAQAQLLIFAFENDRKALDTLLNFILSTDIPYLFGWLHGQSSAIGAEERPIEDMKRQISQANQDYSKTWDEEFDEGIKSVLRMQEDARQRSDEIDPSEEFDKGIESVVPQKQEAAEQKPNKADPRSALEYSGGVEEQYIAYNQHRELGIKQLIQKITTETLCNAFKNVTEILQEQLRFEGAASAENERPTEYNVDNILIILFVLGHENVIDEFNDEDGQFIKCKIKEFTQKLVTLIESGDQQKLREIEYLIDSVDSDGHIDVTISVLSDLSANLKKEDIVAKCLTSLPPYATRLLAGTLKNRSPNASQNKPTNMGQLSSSQAILFPAEPKQQPTSEVELGVPSPESIA